MARLTQPVHSGPLNFEESLDVKLREEACSSFSDSMVEPQEPHRTLWWSSTINSYVSDPQLEDEKDYSPHDVRERRKAWDANLVASLTESGLHAPALDIDFPVRVYASRTKGHFHVYFDKEIPWWRYRVMLWGLKVAGMIEPGYYRASVERRMTMLRWNLRWHVYRSGLGKQKVLLDLVDIIKENE